MQSLSKKHRLFVEAYDGDVAYAMKLAGFTGADGYLIKKGEELLRTPLIIEAIKERTKYMTDLKSTIATREERQKLWTDIMKNQDPHRREEFDANGVPIPEGNIPLPIRLKASELLGKSEADFVDKVDMSTTVSLSEIILKSYDNGSGKSLEDIEAEYMALQDRKEIMDKAVQAIPESLEDLI
jgi:hypothetical protein